MKSLPTIVSTSIALSVCMVSSEELETVECRFNHYDAELGEIWVGLVTNPNEPEARHGSWTLVESQDFELEVPVAEEVELVVVRKDSVFIVKRFDSQSGSRRITFDLHPGKTLQGSVLSTDGHPVSNAVLTLNRSHQLSIQLPDHLNFEWRSDWEGRYAISGLTPGEHEVSVVARRGMPTEVFKVQVEQASVQRYDLNLKDAHFLKGRVVDHDGERVSGAKVRLSNNEGIDILELTESDGSFHHGPFRLGRSLLATAWHDERGSSWGRGIVVRGQDLLLRLSDTVRVLGFVSDAESGEPIGDFTLRSQPQGAPFMASPQTDTDGQLSVSVDTGTLFLALEAPGYVIRFWQVSFVGGGEFDLGNIELHRGRMISGTVFDVTKSVPIEGARVAWSVYDQLQDGGLQDHVIRVAGSHVAVLEGYYSFVTSYMFDTGVAISDQNGEYSLGPLPKEDIEIHAFSTKGFENKSVYVGSSKTSIDIAMQASSPLSEDTRIRGRLVTTEGEPVIGEISSRNRTTYYLKHLRTDENGEFDFPTIPGLHEIYGTTAFGRSNVAKVNVPENTTAEVQLVVDRRGRLIVLLEGLANTETASLKVMNGSVTMQERRDAGNGEILIEGIPVGHYRIMASTSAKRSMNKTFEMVDQDREVNARISFQGVSRLSGKVLTGESSVPLLRLRATPSNPGLASGWSSVQHDGSYEISGLDGGEYTVSLQRLETSAIGFGEETSIVDKFNVLVEGDTHLDIPFVSFSVAGIVNPVDETAGANIHLRQAGKALPIGSAQTDVRGRFQFGGLTSGDYVLTVRHRDFVPDTRTISLTGTNSDIEVFLQPRTKGSLFVAGTVHPVDESTEGTSITLRLSEDKLGVDSVTSDEQGKFIFENLHPNEYILEAYRTGFEPLSKTLSVDESIPNLDVILKPEEPQETEALRLQVLE